ncbi:hypothetical protein HN832_02275 [archaeon]|jgi:hypothetical protein|nr:hypothetical protein [archaeon]MBT4373181.1 hypothetical protein [archaeon]MBT4531526.1 hypothetical protein [archaeon]MBT7001296.1 hypothetical protein [archaeon]MBT7282218.1 hypothetical protein [archaeon]
MRESEQRKKIVEYLKRNLKKGYTLDSLRWALINQDYSKVLIENAIDKVHQELAEKAPILKEKPKITYQIMDEEDNPVNFKKPWWKFFS